MRFKFSYLFYIGLILSLAGGLAAPALSADILHIQVDTILAARDDDVVDPKLKKHIGELQSMFNYTSYRLLGSERLNLKTGQSGMASLPGDRRLKITPNNISGNRADIALQMIKRKRTVFQTNIQLLNRGSLFVGGPTYRSGNLIFKISGSY